jgi:pilus assembly protein CpaE
VSQVIRTTIAVSPGISPDGVRAAVDAEPGIALAAVVPARAEGIERLAADTHDVLLVVCDSDADDVLSFIASAVDARPERPVVVLHPGSTNGFVREAFKAGATDLVVGTATDGDAARLGRDVAFALEKAMARVAGTAGSGSASAAGVGDMIAVLGPKGGTGKTLTSCNLAAGLAAEGARTIIVDLDLQFGDVGLALGLRPDKTIYDLATAGGSMDSEKVADFLTDHPSGVRALLAPRRPDHAGAITVEFTRHLFDTLRHMADYVVVDTPPGFTPEVIAAIDRSSSICVVAMLDALSLKNTKLALETLDLMGYDRRAVKIVLNRADSRVGVTTDDVTELLGHEPDVLVPSHREITRSVNEATPIVLSGGNAEAKRAFQALAASYLPDGEPVDTAATPRRRRARRRRKDKA